LFQHSVTTSVFCTVYVADWSWSHHTAITDACRTSTCTNCQNSVSI